MWNICKTSHSVVVLFLSYLSAFPISPLPFFYIIWSSTLTPRWPNLNRLSLECKSLYGFYAFMANRPSSHIRESRDQFLPLAPNSSFPPVQTLGGSCDGLNNGVLDAHRKTWVVFLVSGCSSQLLLVLAFAEWANGGSSPTSLSFIFLPQLQIIQKQVMKVQD